MHRLFAAFGAALAFTGVAGGAFGAHLLRARLPVDRLVTFETGVRYQLVHALALLFVALAAGRRPAWPWRAAGWSFLSGTLLFSGSLYTLAIGGSRWPGAITPVGGAAFLAGWLLVAAGALRKAG
ncbi:MAG: DUF423 domain-containing protein [Gemmatimonadota bacterium]